MKRSVAFFGNRRHMRGRKRIRVTVARWDRVAKRMRYRPLAPVKRHSPDGFEWGHNGSGPSDLALSMLSEMHDEFTPAVIEKTYRGVRDRLIATVKIDGFQILGDQVRQAVADALEGANDAEGGDTEMPPGDGERHGDGGDQPGDGPRV